MSKDIRKEQLALLRIEKKIAALAAAVAAAGGAAAAADGKLRAEDATAAMAQAQDLLVQLAEVTSVMHASMAERAIELGARMLQATGGGTPKVEAAMVVKSIFGAG